MRQNRVGEPRSFSLFGLFSLVILLSVSLFGAGSFEDFKKTQTESFKKFKDERDNAFSKYLKAEWKAYQLQKGVSLYEEPKPKNITPAKPKVIKSVGPKVSVDVKTIKKIVEKAKEKAVEKEVISADIKPKKVEKKDINIDFFGSKIGIDIPGGIEKARYYPENQTGITHFFEGAASSDYEFFIKEIARISDELNLNDWGRYLLVLKISDQIFKEHDNSSLMSWFIFNKLGYSVKVGLVKNHIVLMHYSKKVIYSTPNYSFKKKRYYIVSHYAKGSVGSLYSYEQSYPGADKPLDLSLRSLPNFESDMIKKNLSFKQSGVTYDVPFEYNKNLIDFMATYPQADYETFFNAPVDSRTYLSVASALKKYIDGKQASDAMNFVLNFVQKAFKYQRDDQQFGREKVMFAQETLFFDKSDCEDRAVLFSYLVKELFHVGVVGVKYKDHMATALYIPMDGDSVRAGSKKMILADPTYINASIGQSMPKYKPLRPESFVIVKN